MLQTQCPTRETLRDFLGGRLSEEDSEQLETHLSGCDLCEETACGLDGEPDTFAEYLHGSPPPPPVRDLGLSAIEGLAQWERPPTVQVTGSVGCYDLQQRLGRGGMGAVYQARHRELDRQVAIKLLPTLAARREEVVARFRREMKAAGRLDHPAIVRATDAGEFEGTHFLVMEVVDGVDLSHAATARPLKVADACEILRQTAIGLSYAHEQGVVHRDIKPSNLMLNARGQVKILDFGLAQLYQADGSFDELTSAGQLMGTLEYMAPEQGTRGANVDARADVYSMGATLFKLLTGRSPLDCESRLSPLEKLRVLADHRLREICEYRSDVPEELQDLVCKMLATDPRDRPANAEEVAEALTKFCEGADLSEVVEGLRENEHASVNASSLVAPKVNQATPHRKPQDRWTGYSFLVIGGCLFLFAMLWGGIALALEFTKGQLIIETDATVTIRVVDEKDRTKELLVQPGTEATRLRDGKYEITIAEPSDGFTFSDGEISIRRGETVIARVVPTPATDAKQDVAAASTEMVPVGPGLVADDSVIPLGSSDSSANFGGEAAVPFGRAPARDREVDSTSAAGSSSDPSGSSPDSDPFGDSYGDPFGADQTRASEDADPFGRVPAKDREVDSTSAAGSSSDPFGSSRDEDPFSADPFGGADHEEGAAASQFDRVPDNAVGVSPITMEQERKHDRAARIYSALNTEIEPDWVELPLSRVATELAYELDIPVWIDTAALESAGVSSDFPLNLSLPPVSARSALKLALDPHELTFVVRNEVLEITAASEIAPFLVQPSDTLAIYIPNVVPIVGEPLMTYQAGDEPPLRGELFRVDGGGHIVLPVLGEIAVGGKSLSEIRYVLNAFYYPSITKLRGIRVDILKRADSDLVVKQLRAGTPWGTAGPSENQHSQQLDDYERSATQDAAGETADRE